MNGAGMINIATETDIEMVRQVALILERENAHLHTRLEKLTAALARAEGKDASVLQLEIEQLKQTLDARNQALFGRSSEKRSPNGKRADQKTTPKRGHGPSEQPSLPGAAGAPGLRAGPRRGRGGGWFT
jgi:hypothetical protein